jgi:hypothetical protein
VDKIHPRLWEHLKQIEPTVEELTKQEYEERMGIRQQWQQSKKVEVVSSPLGADTAAQDDASLYADRTKKEIIAILEERGYEGNLKYKSKKQLIDLL